MKFLKQLLSRSCSHRFTWPRSDANGRDYQICLSCGTAYEYDWRKMKRTVRLQPEVLSLGTAAKYASRLHS